jgi:CRP/FNR family transcriptional regulator
LQEYSIPLSQSELASLIGATRETTSTTLNSLARRGLVRLGRRLLVVSSVDHLRNAAMQRSMHANAGTS